MATAYNHCDIFNFVCFFVLIVSYELTIYIFFM